MAQQKRALRPSEFAKEHAAESDKDKKPKLVVENKDFDERKKMIADFEGKHGEMPPEIRRLKTERVRRFQHHVDMLHSFKVDFQHELQSLGEKPEVAVANPRLHAEASFVFKDAHVRYFVGTRQEEEHYERLGMEAEMVNPEMQLLDKPVDILIALYEGADATWRLERNVKKGGWLICRGEVAQTLLAKDFKKMGTLDPSGGMNRSDKSKETLDWKQAVGNDAKFKAESQKIQPGGRIATYEGAKKVLKAAGKATGEESDHVLENYQQFIEDVLNNKVPHAKVDRERGVITYKTPEMREAIETGIEPPTSAMNLETIVVLKRKRAGEA